MLRRKLVVGAALIAVAGFAGGAYAASQSGTSSHQTFLNDVAKRLNVTPAQLTAAIKGAMIDRLNSAVKVGRITAAQANAIRQRIERGGAGRLLLGPGAGPLLLGPRLLGPRFLGPRGLGPPGLGPPGLGPRLPLPLLPGAPKMRPRSAKAMLAAIRSKLDRAVAMGEITKAREQRLLARIKAWLKRGVPPSFYGPPSEPRPAIPPPPTIGPPPAGPPPGA